MNYYLLAYPRSGSSLFQVLFSYLTGMRPLEPAGNTQWDHITEPWITDQSNSFYKFHYPTDSGVALPQGKNNILIYLRRDPLENIPSYIFSDHHLGEGINKQEFTKEKYKKFFGNVDDGGSVCDEVWNARRGTYRANMRYYVKWPFKKIIIEYEKMVIDDQYLVDSFKDIILPDRNTKKEKIKEIKELVMKEKTGEKHTMKVNTKGKEFNFFSELIPERIKNIIQRYDYHYPTHPGADGNLPVVSFKVFKRDLKTLANVNENLK